MGPWLALLGLLAAPAGPPEPAPSDQSLIYYNARMALREGRPLEATRLWFLRNAVAGATGQVSAHDADFRSLIWAALAAQGLCPDGLPEDDAGAGLWPVALHNWVIRNRRAGPQAPPGQPFDAFRLGRQVQPVSIHDALDPAGLKSLSLRRGFCLWEWRLLTEVGWPWDDLADPVLGATLLRRLLHEAQRTLPRDRVVGHAALAARIFDLNLRLAGETRRAALRARREAVAEARAQGLDRAALDALRADLPPPALDPEAAATLDASLRWPAEEWLTLSADRRQYLFAQAAARAPAQAWPVALAVIDQLLPQAAGAEIEGWIAHASAGEGPARAAARARVWAGDRGQALLALDADSGFRERAVIALHRAVAAVEAGALPSALRDLAFALREADRSAASEEVRQLSRRWLSFVAGRHRLSDDLLTTLVTLAPPGDLRVILEDQLWQAALHGDRASFERARAAPVGGGALSHRAAELAPLAQGDPAAFLAAIAAGLETSPAFTLRLLEQLVERIQAQDGPVRAGHAPLLRALKERLEALASAAQGAQRRRARELLGRLRATLDGLGLLAEAASPGDEAHALSPARDLHAGGVRLAPADPLPWPFQIPVVRAPSVFQTLELRPEEWRGADGALVFGWRIREP